MFGCMNGQAWENGGHSVAPVLTAVAAECRRMLPSSYNLRWLDQRSLVHCCLWFLCEFLEQLTDSRLPVEDVTAVFNDVFYTLVDLSCQWTYDVSTGVSSVLSVEMSNQIKCKFIQRRISQANQGCWM